MRAVRSHGNKATELVLVRLLRHHRIAGWRRRFKLEGQPDFVFPNRRIALFVDGCYWHGCLQHCRVPKGNRAYWRAKIAGNRQRDRKVNRTLRAGGWRVVRIWEHALARQHETRLMRRLKKALVAHPGRPVGRSA